VCLEVEPEYMPVTVMRSFSVDYIPKPADIVATHTDFSTIGRALFDWTGRERAMAWIVLVISGMLEAVWATALSAASKRTGRGRFVPIATFVLAAALSMGGLLFAMAELPPGTTYAVWVGIGAALTVAWGMVRREEPVSMLRIVLLAGVILCVAGLKVVS
jgi:quaternary ammonium compound-resistance protein SugE